MMVCPWGLVSRGIAAVLCLAVANFWSQVVPLFGRRGISPIALFHARLREDLSFAHAVLLNPTIFWACASDVFLRAAVALGAAGGAAAALLGPASDAFAPALALAHIAYVSLINADAHDKIHYPWQSLLGEAGWLALLLPSGSRGVSRQQRLHPSRALEYSFVWLLFRLMFGFGKKKFLSGPWRKHRFYIRDFFIRNPSPTPCARAIHAGAAQYTRAPKLLPCCCGVNARASLGLPPAFFPLALDAMYVAEIVLPFAFFLPQPWCTFAAVATIGMMVGIELSGNFGHFNILTAVLCVPLCADFDASAIIGDGFSASSEPLARAPLGWVGWMLCSAMGVSGLVHLLFDSLVDAGVLATLDAFAPSSPRYTTSFVERCGIDVIARLLAVLKAWHITHAYGVFPAESGPATRLQVVFEGTNDGGATWREYATQQHGTGSADGFGVTAPLQSFFDYELFYTGLGLLSHTHPYGLSQRFPFAKTRVTKLHRVRERLLQGGEVGTHGQGQYSSAIAASLFQNDPFPYAPPTEVRVRLELLALHVGAVGETGGSGLGRAAARRFRVCTLLPAAGQDPTLWEQWLRPPLLEPPSYARWMRRDAIKEEFSSKVQLATVAFWCWVARVKVLVRTDATLGLLAVCANSSSRSCRVQAQRELDDALWMRQRSVAFFRVATQAHNTIEKSTGLGDTASHIIATFERCLRRTMRILRKSCEDALPTRSAYDVELLTMHAILFESSVVQTMMARRRDHAAGTEVDQVTDENWRDPDVDWERVAMHATAETALMLRSALWLEATKRERLMNRVRSRLEGQSLFHGVMPMVEEQQRARANVANGEEVQPPLSPSSLFFSVFLLFAPPDGGQEWCEGLDSMPIFSENLASADRAWLCTEGKGDPARI